MQMPPPEYAGTRERDALIRLHEVNHRMTAEPPGAKVLAAILDHAIAFTRAEHGCVILKGPRGLELRAARTTLSEKDEHKFPRSVIEAVLRASQPVVIGDAAQDEQFGLRESVRAMGHASLACIPLRVEGQAIGVIYLDHRYRKGLFRSEDLMVLETFAHLAAACLEAARLKDYVAELQEEMKLLRAQVDYALRERRQASAGGPTPDA